MKPYEAFLQKIGVTLPEPRTMGGFGVELPNVYLDRCLEIIVPATEEFIKKQLAMQNAVVTEDFINYIQQYKGFSNVSVKKNEDCQSAVLDVVSDVVEATNKSVNEVMAKSADNFDASKNEEEISSQPQRTTLKRADQYTAVYEYFTKNPLATREDCIKALGISINTLTRRLRDLYYDKNFSPKNAGYTPRPADEKELQKHLAIIRDFIKLHPNAYKLEIMRSLGYRRDELDVYLRLLSKEGVFTDRKA